jgi:hypothetical protein
MEKNGFKRHDYRCVCMWDWREASPEERKMFIIDSAIAATIIVIGSIAAIIL